MPLLLVIAEVADSLPRVVEKLIGALGTGVPPSRIIAVIVEFMVEPAGRIVGDAMTVTVPWAMITVVVFDRPSHVALTVAVPEVAPE